jgi:ribulose-5-phosphate 4-epimerase/fuculose-1-phosphate aldolase
MSVRTVSTTSAVRQSVSEQEWQTRVELAASHRLMAHFGVHDLTHNHLTARVPDAPGHFLIKQADAMFEEVTASTLVKFDFDGKPQQDGFPDLRGGGLIIHTGLFAARPDINVVFHTHTPANIGVASQKQGLLPMTQHGVRFHDAIAYHDFGGFEFNMEMRAPLIDDLGDKFIALLRNHGALVCGASIGATYVDHHNLEIACQAQIAALSGGSEIILIDPRVRELAAKQSADNASRRGGGGKDWVACMRLAERLDPAFMD